jgi:lysophospholipase L1-like esterase
MRTLISVVSCLLILGCSDSNDMSGGPVLMPPSGSGGTSAGASAAGASGSAAAGTSATGVAGRAAAGSGAAGSGVAGSAGNPPAMSDDDAGVTTPSDAGMMPMLDAEPMMPVEPTREDLGKGDGSDVITIGDSWMSLGATGIQQSLVEVSGQPYRTYGRGGTRLLNEAIPNQYDTAKRADADIKTVIMTGGGNDIIQVPGLRDDCANMGAQCTMVTTQILDRLTMLWEEMAADGVQDVVYVQYSNPEGNNVDFALPSGDGVPKRCSETKAPLRCHRLETLDIVMGDIPDGIHPSAAGYDRLGKAVHDLMIEEGMRR